MGSKVLRKRTKLDKQSVSITEPCSRNYGRLVNGARYVGK